MHLIYAILGMDVVWAVIDMYIFYRADLMSLNRSLMLYWELHDQPDRESKKKLLESEFYGTVFQVVSKEDQDKMLDVFLDGTFTGREGLKKSNRHYLFNAVTTFVFAAAPAIPPVICLQLIGNFSYAILNASVISCILSHGFRTADQGQAELPLLRCGQTCRGGEDRQTGGGR